ncbi:uncharacterized protein IL334_000040 [Kwoniella shivajii]|uniref:Uncharacterized protein n=1 Tax=Kwoniella shivajii TaxID=564305 RepID=A0ABZ1CP53_9TREE|nr:hypothetical protein IL334_000040 [Kwoniella shivajii]
MVDSTNLFPECESDLAVWKPPKDCYEEAKERLGGIYGQTEELEPDDIKGTSVMTVTKKINEEADHENQWSFTLNSWSQQYRSKPKDSFEVNSDDDEVIVIDTESDGQSTAMVMSIRSGRPELRT